MLDFLYILAAVLAAFAAIFFPNKDAIVKAARKRRDDEILDDDRHDSIVPDPDEIVPMFVPDSVRHVPSIVVPNGIIQPAPASELEYPPETIEFLLDGGHGPETAGKRSPVLDDGRQLLEWEFNDAVLRKVLRRAKEKGLRTVDLVPDKTGLGNALELRVQRANAISSPFPQMFVSLHGNAMDPDPGKQWQRKARGCEVWHFHGSAVGYQAADTMCDAVCERTGFNNRGPKSRSSKQFYVLRKTRPTAILVESGFFNHPEEVLKMLDDGFRESIAAGIVLGMIRIQNSRMFG